MNFLKQALLGENEFWQYLVTIVAVVIAYILGQAPLTMVLFSKIDDPQEMIEITETMDFERVGIDANVGLVLILLTFIAAFLTLRLCVPHLHKRPFLTLITSSASIRWKRVFFAFGLWMLFTFILEGISYLTHPEDCMLQFEWKGFILLLGIALFLLPIQTSFEEIFFRGYLLQGIHLMSNRWIALIVTSVGFGMMHLANPEIEKFGTELMMTYYIGVGFFLGILTIIDDGLELALGIHAATNIFGSVFVTFDGSALQTKAIFRTDYIDVSMMLLLFLVMATLFFLICWKRYGWRMEQLTSEDPFSHTDYDEQA